MPKNQERMKTYAPISFQPNLSLGAYIWSSSPLHDKGEDDRSEIGEDDDNALSFSFDGFQLFSLLCSTLMSTPAAMARLRAPPTLAPASCSEFQRPSNELRSFFLTSPAVFCRLCSLLVSLWRSIIQADPALQLQRGAPRPYLPWYVATSCACTAPRQPCLQVTGNTDAPTGVLPHPFATLVQRAPNVTGEPSSSASNELQA